MTNCRCKPLKTEKERKVKELGIVSGLLNVSPFFLSFPLFCKDENQIHFSWKWTILKILLTNIRQTISPLSRGSYLLRKIENNANLIHRSRFRCTESKRHGNLRANSKKSTAKIDEYIARRQVDRKLLRLRKIVARSRSLDDLKSPCPSKEKKKSNGIFCSLSWQFQKLSRQTSRYK